MISKKQATSEFVNEVYLENESLKKTYMIVNFLLQMQRLISIPPLAVHFYQANWSTVILSDC